MFLAFMLATNISYMKKFLLLVSVSLAFMSFRFQNGSTEIVNALKQGNAEQFSKYFDNILDIKLPEKDEIKNVGKNQATITLKNFFEDNNVKGFDVTSERELGGTMYMTGKLQGASKNYNLTLMIKNKSDKLAIITIRISNTSS